MEWDSVSYRFGLQSNRFEDGMGHEEAFTS